MRNINFIRPTPPHRHKELRRWIFGSSFLVVSILVAISAITGIQWRMYRAVNQEKNILMHRLASYDQVMNKQRDQTQQQTALQQKLQQLQAYTTTPKNPIDIITTVQKILGQMPIQSLSIDADHFELKGNCTTAKHATQLVSKLNSLALCKQAQLHSISTGNANQLQFVIKGMVL